MKNLEVVQYDKSQLDKLVSERPFLNKLQVPYHLRSEEERKDIEVLSRRVDPHPLYVGLAGGRQAGKVFLSPQRALADLFPKDTAEDKALSLCRELPRLVKNASGIELIDLTGFCTLTHMVMAHQLFYDIDLIVIPRRVSFDPSEILYGNISDIGPRSGTPFDMFVITATELINNEVPFLVNIFNNSSRIAF